MAAAILVPLGLIIIVRLVWDRGNAGARLAAIGGVLFALWALVAVANLGAALKVAGGTAMGIVGFIHGLAALIMNL